MQIVPHRNSGRRLLAAATSLAAAVAGAVFTAVPSHADTPVTQATGQKIAVPAYIYPSGTGATQWSQIASGAVGGIAIANIANGPSNSVDTNWQTAIQNAHNAGVKVLGYVDTGYLGGTNPPRLTRLRDSSLGAWVVQAEADVNAWYRLYGSSIDGIFFDDGQNVCGPTTGSTTYSDAYTQLNQYVKQYFRGAQTVLNPGIDIPQCYENAADTILNFEDSYTAYTTFVPQAWESGYDPHKFMHIIHSTPSAQMQDAINRSKNNGAGYVYVTDAVMPNPYNTLPSYWSSELNALPVASTGTPATPATPTTSNVGGTSLTLTWPSDSTAAGYDVYQNGVLISPVTNAAPTDTSFTVTGLSPSTSYTFTVKARDLANDTSASSPGVTATTAAPDCCPPTVPGTVTVSNLKANSVELDWTASTSSVDTVAYYDVYQNSTRILTLPATLTTARFDGLTPGSNYSFTIVARDTTGAASTASTPVAVTTPNPATAITNTASTLTASTATYSATFNLEYTWHIACIDSDNASSTGYQLNLGGTLIGCDYMIQENTLYHYTGSGTDWSWSTVSGTTPQESVNGDTYSWQIPASSLGTHAATEKVAFNGSGYSPNAWSSVLTVTQQ